MLGYVSFGINETVQRLHRNRPCSLKSVMGSLLRILPIHLMIVSRALLSIRTCRDPEAYIRPLVEAFIIRALIQIARLYRVERDTVVKAPIGEQFRQLLGPLSTRIASTWPLGAMIGFGLVTTPPRMGVLIAVPSISCTPRLDNKNTRSGKPSISRDAPKVRDLTR